MVRKFYSDENPIQKNNQEGDNLETKADEDNSEIKTNDNNLKN